MRKDFLVFGSPQIEQAEIDEVTECLRSGWWGAGPRVARFEKAFAKYRRADYAVALNSCTAALHLSLLAAGLEPGDEVITTPMTFCASVNAIIHAGAKPVLADVDPVSMNIDPRAVEAAVTPRTKAVLPVHFAGRPCDMDRIMALADQRGFTVIEDCAHAIETEYHGQPAGTFGRFGCFSFYVTKNLATGEGGLVLTRDAGAAGRIKRLALHGMSADAWKRFGDEGYKHYFVVEPGYKYTMMDLQASIGLHQLERVEANWKRRLQIWNRYLEELADLPLCLPAPFEPDTRHGLHLFTILVDEKNAGVTRDELLTRMTKSNIGVGVHYMSVPEHPYYQDRYGWTPDAWPVARDIGRATLSLPLSAKLTDQDVTDVVEAVRAGLKR
ncbi:MAG: hypothetical protein PWQ57_3204 [Desulfovibrionales bacterium]|nr:hypothetical protein [Desulfovibrionales bacterium]